MSDRLPLGQLRWFAGRRLCGCGNCAAAAAAITQRSSRHAAVTGLCLFCCCSVSRPAVRQRQPVSPAGVCPTSSHSTVRYMLLLATNRPAQSPTQPPPRSYNLAMVERLYRAWGRLMPRVHPCYAVKCNPDEGLLAVLAAMGAGFDCASEAEIAQVGSRQGAGCREGVKAECKPGLVQPVCVPPQSMPATNVPGHHNCLLTCCTLRPPSLRR